ncbi:PilZ domain-containing protein [Oceanisphaera sp.]|uniref:PilZ domain-containing protein n=1 Tax=Oceanisphaera sp. TaxID=1929979 RepID=UPI003A8DCA76
MPSHPYLTDEELAMINEQYSANSPNTLLTLPLVMDANIEPLLEQATALELKLDLGQIKLSFPVTLNHPVASQEQVVLSAPNIITNGGHPRAWRLPHPQNIKLEQPDGKPLAAEIRDLSINGMMLLSLRSLFTSSSGRPAQKKVILRLGQAQQLPLQLTLVRQHKGAQFWLTAVCFELDTADKSTLSDFVFRGFLAQINRQQAP